MRTCADSEPRLMQQQETSASSALWSAMAAGTATRCRTVSACGVEGMEGARGSGGVARGARLII